MSFDIPLPRKLLVGPPGATFEYRFHMFPWWRYQQRHETTLRALDTYDVRWFDLVGEPDPLAPFVGKIPPDGRAFAVMEFQEGGLQGKDHPLRRVLSLRGEFVACFGPYVDVDPPGDRTYGHKLTYDHTGPVDTARFFEWRSTYAGRILAARRLGPILEVYRIPPTDVSELRSTQD